jgi:hypothetical protein
LNLKSSEFVRERNWIPQLVFLLVSKPFNGPVGYCWPRVVAPWTNHLPLDIVNPIDTQIFVSKCLSVGWWWSITRRGAPAQIEWAKRVILAIRGLCSIGIDPLNSTANQQLG